MQPQLFHEVIEKADALYNDKVALIAAGNSFSFTELNEYANGLAFQFKEQGIEEGDRVVIALGNTVETIIAFWATLKAGAIACPIGLDVAAKKLDYIMHDSGAKLCLNQESLDQFNLRHAMQKRPALMRVSSDLASILYTSGSTGEPKGVMLSHENMLAALLSLNTYLQYRKEDKVVCVSPLSFDYGLYQMLMSISQGAELHLFKNLLLPSSLLKSIEKNKLTVLPGVPTLYSVLFEHSSLGDFDLSSIRMVTNTGAAMTLRHIDMTKALFPQAQIFSMYGLTECKRCTYLPPQDLDRKPNSVGIAIPHTSIWIADEHGEPLPANQVGQLIVEGKTVMQGYWNKPDATQQKIPRKPGQLFTGDYGYIDEEGYFYFVGRMDDMLKCRGQKVSPKELEDILIQMDGVKEVAVIGVPDTDESDAIYLHIAPFAKDGLSEVAVREYCLSHLSSHQQPKKIMLHDALPKSENGKINKQILKRPQSLSDLVRNTIAKYPERQALCIEGKNYTYKDLDQKAKLCAQALSGAEGEVLSLIHI
jgi:amino acid adenylation domain-containing protein